jgi:hypothetical protein
VTAGDRRLVREAVAGYFGGSVNTVDAGIYYQGGPLSALGLGTTYPYKIKKGAPDVYYTLGEADGTGWGAVMSVRLAPVDISRMPSKGGAMGGQTSGWRARHYTTVCSFDVISYLPHLETAEAAFDDLLDAWVALIYADRTLGTTSDVYPTGRLITQAGEWTTGIRFGEPDWSDDEDRGRGRGGIDVTFDCLTMIAA